MASQLGQGYKQDWVLFPGRMQSTEHQAGEAQHCQTWTPTPTFPVSEAQYYLPNAALPNLGAAPWGPGWQQG